MKRTLCPTLGFLAILLASTISCLAFPFGQNPTPQEGAAPVSSEEAPMEALLTQSLALRSVKISLKTEHPGGRDFHLAAEVDGSGNTHLTKTFIGEPPEGLPTPVNPEAALPETYEMYVIDGAAYSPDDNGELVKAYTTELVNFLEETIRGPEGPGLWLLILPEGSLTAQGAEQKDGFEAQKYSIRGDIEGKIITGTIWIDSAGGALVGADLQIPAALYHLPDTPAEGTVTIQFEVSKEEIAPIGIPGN